MVLLKRVTIILKSAGILCLTLIIILTASLYLQASIYSFKKPASFSGDSLYNPYENISGNWIKANFHAHSIAWGHLTNGHQTPSEIENVYSKMGYQVACVSNYEDVVHSKNANIKSLPVYEHGYNIFKTHQLVFKPQKVSFFDLPFLQTTSMKQSVLKVLSDESACIALAHPLLKNGYTDQELKKLTGYNLLEVLNHSAESAKKWDVVLSSGKPVWCVGNDDMHDAKNKSEVGVCWTMVNSSGNGDVIDQLKNGNAYGACGKNGVVENALRDLTVSGDTMRLLLAKNAEQIKLIGQNGVMKKVITNADSAKYVFKTNDTYIRAEIINKDGRLYLNPVIRYNGKQTPSNISTASVNIIGTFFYRMSIILLCSGFLFLLYIKAAIRLLDKIKNIGLKSPPDYSCGTA